MTDRVVLDNQISETVKQFTQVSSAVGQAETSADLRRLITEGKKIIITTVQKFPFIAKAMAEEHLDRRFAIIIDEAHSSQGGQTSAKMNAALGDQADDEEEDYEDQINRIIESRKMLDNASYFAFINHLPGQVLEDEAYRNAKMNSDRQNAQIEHDSVVRRLITAMVRCQTELYKAYSSDADFRQWLNAEMFRMTYQTNP